jgi:hypothetical protein
MLNDGAAFRRAAYRVASSSDQLFRPVTVIFEPMDPGDAEWRCSSCLFEVLVVDTLQK